MLLNLKGHYGLYPIVVQLNMLYTNNLLLCVYWLKASKHCFISLYDRRMNMVHFHVSSANTSISYQNS